MMHNFQNRGAQNGCPKTEERTSLSSTETNKLFVSGNCQFVLSEHLTSLIQLPKLLL